MAGATTQVPAKSAARILIADDHAVVRTGVRALLSMNSQWQVCGEAVNGKEAVEKVQKLRPDLIVLDIAMPVMDGIEAAREIRRVAPAIKILILSLHDFHQLEVIARQAGADAFVRKEDAATSLTKAIEGLVGGNPRS
jgi:DNA-binding NarL/FixJ family response regulator